jgi:NAD(P)-dependent dehydrogenase (short-subunit alcohol dehydrogenase family)
MNARAVVLITGATGGLGQVLAADLAAEGWDLALIGSDVGRLEGLRDGLSLPDERVLLHASDLRDAAPAAEAVAAAYARYGRVDALAHLVGGWTGGVHCVDAADDDYATMLAQHLWSTLYVLRPLVPRMVEAGFGRIVAVSSPVASAPDAGMSAYAVGKAAQETLLATVARETAGTGVTVNVLRVRSIDTSGVRERDPKGRGVSMTTPAELSAAIRYLFSDAARVVTGQRIGLHGGA